VARLVVEDLSHRFGPKEILRGIRFGLEAGEVVSVVGPSGGGKTTLLRLCAGLLEVEEGRVENHFSRSAFAFQDPRLLPWQNTLDNIAFGLKATGVERAQRQRRAMDIALDFGLEADDLKKFPKDLSGGMRQRASFARALVVEPELLFLDEPFSALDIGLKLELQQLLVHHIESREMAVLFITHDLMEAVRLSDRILLLAADPGRIVHHFEIPQSRSERGDEFVYEETARLLQHPRIMETFELTLEARG